MDDDSGEEFNAYLAEVRSIGGLSGSPVFVALNPSTRLNVFDRTFEDPGGLTFYLLGLLRGHWNQRAESGFRGEMGSLNTGIAMVTPITEIIPLLERKQFVRHRNEFDDRIRRERLGEQVKDFGESHEPARSEFERFEDLARTLVNVPKKEIDEKRKEED